MQNENRKFLDFNGRNINVLSKDGTYWVALKPICEALGVNWNRQFQNLKEDVILSGVFAIQQTHDTTNRLQEMVCLPEKYVYGWLFSINSKSEELMVYKKECYDVLYEYFHGATTKRLESLKVRLEAEEEMKLLAKQLKESDIFKRLKEAQVKLYNEKKLLDVQDRELMESQLNIFGKKSEN